jgi:predicted O-methyltransferase YrrM
VARGGGGSGPPGGCAARRWGARCAHPAPQAIYVRREHVGDLVRVGLDLLGRPSALELLSHRAERGFQQVAYEPAPCRGHPGQGLAEEALHDGVGRGPHLHEIWGVRGAAMDGSGNANRKSDEFVAFCPERRGAAPQIGDSPMTCLTEGPLAPLLARLFADAEASSPLQIPALAALSQQERERLLRSKSEYRSVYEVLKDCPLPVSRETGRLLYMLARSAGARSIVEFGTSFGISTLHLAAALRDNGGGLLITTEFEPSKIARARRNLSDAGLADLVEIREGDALDTLAHGLPERVDLVLLDGAKPLYLDVLGLVESSLRPGSLVVADNAGASPEYLARVRAVEHSYLSLPFGQDVELSLRVRG